MEHASLIIITSEKYMDEYETRIFNNKFNKTFRYKKNILLCN